MNEKRVNPLDICLFRTVVLFIVSVILTKATGLNFHIPSIYKKILLVRCFVGATGYTCITFGISMVPLVVQNTIFNMAPFWTFFLGWLFLNDGISSFEIFALVCSFGGVLLIATSENKVDVDEPPKFGQDGITGLSGRNAQIVGSLLCLVCSWCYAIVCIQTRMM